MKTTENGKFHSLIKPCFAYKQRTIMILAKPQSNDAFFHWIWIAEREIYATTNSLQAIVHLQLKSRTSTFQNATLRKTPHGFVWKTFALALAEKLILRKKILIICNCLNSKNNQTFLSCFFCLVHVCGPAVPILMRTICKFSVVSTALCFFYLLPLMKMLRRISWQLF